MLFLWHTLWWCSILWNFSCDTLYWTGMWWFSVWFLPTAPALRHRKCLGKNFLKKSRNLVTWCYMTSQNVFVFKNNPMKSFYSSMNFIQDAVKKKKLLQISIQCNHLFAPWHLFFKEESESVVINWNSVLMSSVIRAFGVASPYEAERTRRHSWTLPSRDSAE